MSGITARGRQLFASVYDPHTEKLLAKLGSYHPDFPSMCNGFFSRHLIGTTQLTRGSRGLLPPLVAGYISGVLSFCGAPCSDFIIHSEYGGLLSDPPDDKWPVEGRVGRTLTSVTGVACLRANGGVGPQLTSHVHGLLKAHNYESDGDAAGTGEGEQWLSTPEGATWVINTVDKLMEVLKESPAAVSGKL